MSELLIIDSDSAIYACAFICEQKEHYGILDDKLIYTTDNKNKYNKWLKEQPRKEDIVHDFTEELLPFKEAKKAIDGWIKQLMKLSLCTRKVVLLTRGGTDFRTYLATLQKYKGNRDDLRKPVYYDRLRTYLINNHKALVYVKWEADDTARMSLEKVNAKGEKAVIANIDKDLEQIPGRHMNPNHKDWGVYVISEFDGAYSFYKQMLMGDGADNIPGLKGVGAKKADLMLEGCDTPEMLCRTAYQAYADHYGATVRYIPWWWEKKYDDKDYKDHDLVMEQRKRYPERDATVPMSAVFRENADLLYMLKSPTDQWVAEDAGVRKQFKPYPKGVVQHILGD